MSNNPSVIDTLVEFFAELTDTVFHGSIDLATIEPARIGDWLKLDQWGGDAVSVLSVMGFGASTLFFFVILYVTMQQRALARQIADGTGEETAQSVPHKEPVTGILHGRWESVRTALDSPREADWKIALLEADKLMDDALARAGFSGDTFGDRLTNMAPGALASLDGIWWAHKMRNRIAHEPDYFLRYTEARQAFGYYEAALQELRFL